MESNLATQESEMPLSKKCLEMCRDFSKRLTTLEIKNPETFATFYKNLESIPLENRVSLETSTEYRQVVGIIVARLADFVFKEDGSDINISNILYVLDEPRLAKILEVHNESTGSRSCASWFVEFIAQNYYNPIPLNPENIENFSNLIKRLQNCGMSLSEINSYISVKTILKSDGLYIERA